MAALSARLLHGYFHFLPVPGNHGRYGPDGTHAVPAYKILFHANPLPHLHLPDKKEARLVHYIIRNSENNKSIAYSIEKKGSKVAKLDYRLIASGDKYHLLEIDLHTGRHHQIRAQLAAIGLHIKGDLKYGAARSNPDGGISLHARKVVFIHPVKKEEITIIAPPPKDSLWDYFMSELDCK